MSGINNEVILQSEFYSLLPNHDTEFIDVISYLCSDYTNENGTDVGFLEFIYDMIDFLAENTFELIPENKTQIKWIKTFTVDYVKTIIKNILNRFGSNETKLMVANIDNAYETLLFKHGLIQI
jgi:hypothetical protein